MKKILVTGFTRAACTRDFHKSSQIGLCTAHYSFVKCLEDLGWEVEQRPVTTGENLGHYDKVVVFMMHISPYNTYMYGALWTLSQRPDAYLAIEDWQSPKNINTWRGNVDKIFDSITNDYYINNVVAEKELREEWKPYLKQGLKNITKGDRPVTLPAHLGGDFKMLFPHWDQDKIHSWFAPAYTLHRQAPVSLFEEPKQKVFNFAGLIQSETERWFNKVTEGVTWKVKQYGSAKKKQVRLSEEDMVAVFNDQWGILMAGYWHAGSGWWRARPQQVADVGSILICEDKEGAVFGEPYVGLTCAKVEAMSDAELTKLAKDQKEAYYDSQPMDKEITKKQIEEYLS
jgi:hypothetical protein